MSGDYDPALDPLAAPPARPVRPDTENTDRSHLTRDQEDNHKRLEQARGRVGSVKVALK